MATKAPRTYVTLSSHALKVVERLAIAQGSTKSRAIGQIIEDLCPVLEQLTITLNTVKRLQGRAPVSLQLELAKQEAELQRLALDAQTGLDVAGETVADYVDPENKPRRRRRKPQGA